MTLSRWIPAVAVLLPMFLLHAQTPPKVPRKAAEFTIYTVGSKPLLLSDYKGKAVIMAFILTDCSHCQEAVRILTKLQNEFGSKGLQVLAAAIEADSDKHVNLFNRNFKPSFPIGYANQIQAAALLPPMTTSSMAQMPLLAFIDREGTIVYQTEGEMPFFQDEEANMRKQIALLLKTPGGPAAKSAPAPAAKKAAPKSTKQ